MNKFHLVTPFNAHYDPNNLKKIEEFVRTTNKVLYFTDLKVTTSSLN
jgi:hypothetical protein